MRLSYKKKIFVRNFFSTDVASDGLPLAVFVVIIIITFIFGIVCTLLVIALKNMGMNDMIKKGNSILKFIGPISYLGACYIRTTVTKCIPEKMTLYFRG